MRMKAEEYGGIVDAGTSLRRYYGLDGSGKGDPVIDQWLNENQFRCVAAVLVDGMGISVMRKHLPQDSFLTANIKEEISTVFPPTTAAATTAFLTGKYPCETGWLGWNQYFAEKHDQIIMFYNKGQYTSRTYGNYTYEVLPVHMIYDELNAKGIQAETFWPSWSRVNPCKDFRSMCEKINAAVHDENCRFVYGYWDELDNYMHDFGPSDSGTGVLLEEIQSEIEKLSDRLPEDTGLLVLADHSQIDVRHFDMLKNRSVAHTFVHCPSLEARACSIWVREGYSESFEENFHKLLGDSFVLMTHQEAVESGLFGKGKPHARFEDFIGDYLAVAVSDVQLDYGRNAEMKGNHAGGCREEAIVPVILVP